MKKIKHKRTSFGCYNCWGLCGNFEPDADLAHFWKEVTCKKCLKKLKELI